MATSRPIRQGDRLTRLNDDGPGGYGSYLKAEGKESVRECVLQDDFGLTQMFGWEYCGAVCNRVFGVPHCTNFRDPRLAAAITNGTAPGLYVREGDDTSDWETYRRVLARRVEEAMAARGDGVGGVGVGETAMVAETVTTRQDDEIRVGDVVEVVSCRSIDWTTPVDVGRRGRVTWIDKDTGIVRLETQPREWIAGLADVRKVSSPSPQTVATDVSPMPDGEVARIEAAVTDEVRRRSVVDDMRRATPRDFTAAAITDYLQSLGATHIHVNQVPGRLPMVEVTGLSQQAFDTARQNLPVGIQMRAVGGVAGRRVDAPTADADRRPVPATAGVYIGPATIRFGDRVFTGTLLSESSIVASPLAPQQPTQPSSRFSLLEVDTDPHCVAKAAPPPKALHAPVDLAALQAELRAEREAKRALAAAQTPTGRFDLLECDLPAVPTAATATKSPRRPVVSSPPPLPRSPVETITDLTAARSLLELARMLEGLNDELSTMMRQRDAN